MESVNPTVRRLFEPFGHRPGTPRAPRVIDAGHVQFSDKATYEQIVHDASPGRQDARTTLVRTPPKVNGRDRKRTRKAVRRRLRGTDVARS